MKIVIIDEKSRHYDREFYVIAEYSDGSVCVDHEYYTFQKGDFIPAIVYNSKLYKALN